jgi:hypothetical protein
VFCISSGTGLRVCVVAGFVAEFVAEFVAGSFDEIMMDVWQIEPNRSV